MSPETAASLRTKLIDRRRKLEKAVAERGSLDDIVSLVEQVDAALRRMDNHTYGTCAVCGEEIAPKRLHAIPEATTCVRCQENLEVSRTGPRTEQGPVRSFKGGARPSLEDDA